MKVTFTFERETKGTVVYRETTADGQLIESNRDSKIDTIYFQKTSEVGQQRPSELVAEFTWTKKV